MLAFVINTYMWMLFRYSIALLCLKEHNLLNISLLTTIPQYKPHQNNLRYVR